MCSSIGNGGSGDCDLGRHGRSMCGFTTVSVNSFGFVGEIDAEPESPASSFTASSEPV